MMRMGMDDLLEFLQKTLETNFGYEVGVVIPIHTHVNKCSDWSMEV